MEVARQTLAFMASFKEQIFGLPILSVTFSKKQKTLDVRHVNGGFEVEVSSVHGDHTMSLTSSPTDRVTMAKSSSHCSAPLAFGETMRLLRKCERIHGGVVNLKIALLSDEGEMFETTLWTVDEDAPLLSIAEDVE